LGLSDKQGELGNRVGGVGAAAQNVYAASPFNAIAGFIGEKSGGDYRMKSTVEEAVELYKKIEQVKKNIAQIDQENREKEKAADNAKMAAEANQVKNAYEKLAIEKGQGPIAAYIFEQKLKIAEAEKQGNTALAKNLSLLTDYNVRLMGNARVEEHIKKIKDEQTKADEKRKKEEEETASIKQRNDKRIIDRERGRLPIMDQIEAKTQDIEAMRAKMADMSGPEAEKMREAIIGEEDKLQGLLDKAKTSTSVTTSKGSLITDSLARVGGGGGVFQSGPQQSFTKITSNTDQLVKLATSINERIGPGTVYVE
jgi:DNA repair exonuclease SbcCD ATPase subunit